MHVHEFVDCDAGISLQIISCLVLPKTGRDYFLNFCNQRISSYQSIKDDIEFFVMQVYWRVIFASEKRLLCT